jgi:AbrB family looped-hinge helix DNA binding protein
MDGILTGMRTTIDALGRLVVPKPLRDRLHLRAGQAFEIDEKEAGVLELRPVSAKVRIVQTAEGPVAEALEEIPTLTDATVRETLERIRR